MAKKRTHKPARFVCGPFEGVRDTWDAGAQQHEKWAQDAVNCYLADLPRGRSLHARPGITALHQFTAGLSDRTSCLHHHTTTDGTEYRFAYVDTRLWRIAADGLSSTDVTPVGTGLAGSYRPTMISFGDNIIVSNGSDRPWIMSNLSATPVTRTYIDYDGAGTAWAAWGRPTVAAGKLIFICHSLNSVTARQAIMWSEEGDASVGYQQSGYDNLWELTQSDTDALTAIVGTNSGIVVFREDSITRIEGLTVDQFQTSATFDGISNTLGCPYWATVQRVGRHIWFVARGGRVHRMSEDGTIDEPWRDMASEIARKNAESGAITSLTLRAEAAYDQNLDVVVFGLWKATSKTHPSTLYVFDAKSGRYCGRWQMGGADIIDGGDDGCEVFAMAPLKDSNGRFSLCFLSVLGGFVGLEAPSLRRLRLASENVWTDTMESFAVDGASNRYFACGVKTHLLGDDSTTRVVLDRVVTEHPWDPDEDADTIRLHYHTPALARSAQLTATARLSSDQTNLGSEIEVPGRARATFGLGQNAQGRWVRLTIIGLFAQDTTPTSNTPFGFDRVTAFGQIVPDMDEY